MGSDSFMLRTPTDLLPMTLAAPNMSGAIGWSLVLILFVVMAVFLLMKLRRWIKEDTDTEAGEGTGFTLSDFRRLHREGKMSDEEFERLRSMMLAGAKKMAENLPDPLARGRAGQPPVRKPPAAPPDELSPPR